MMYIVSILQVFCERSFQHENQIHIDHSGCGLCSGHRDRCGSLLCHGSQTLCEVYKTASTRYDAASLNDPTFLQEGRVYTAPFLFADSRLTTTKRKKVRAMADHRESVQRL